MADPNAPIEATYYRCVAYGGVIGGGGYVYMNENEIVREVVRTSPEYVAAVANGWLYVFRMLTAEHGWCHSDDVRSVFSVAGGVAENQPPASLASEICPERTMPYGATRVTPG